MSESASEGDVMPEFWVDGFAVTGIPRWAALQAWNEASDDDTVLDIKRRAVQIAGGES